VQRAAADDSTTTKTRFVKKRKGGRKKKAKPAPEPKQRQSVSEKIKEMDAEAERTGAYMDTFGGKLLTGVTIGLSLALVFWEVYLNIFVERKAPPLNVLDQIPQMGGDAGQIPQIGGDAK